MADNNNLYEPLSCDIKTELPTLAGLKAEHAKVGDSIRALETKLALEAKLRHMRDLEIEIALMEKMEPELNRYKNKAIEVAHDTIEMHRWLKDITLKVPTQRQSGHGYAPPESVIVIEQNEIARIKGLLARVEGKTI